MLNYAVPDLVLAFWREVFVVVTLFSKNYYYEIRTIKGVRGLGQYWFVLALHA